jgi:SSS family solute:Na+ symporter/sodium/pantothenate symporter
MPNEALELGNGAIVVGVVYLIVLLALGWLGRVKRKEESLADFYLAGSSFGFMVLFLTLFATQYSGNTLLGFAGRSYQQGATYIVSVTFMIVVLAVILIYAPRLFRLSRRFGYITPADFVFHRFRSHRVRVMAVLLMCWGLANYILEQLVAMGHGVEAITGGRLGFMQGVVLLAVVMLIYESLGGMRSVAWTDVVQGSLLLVGCGALLYILMTNDGGVVEAARSIELSSPEKLDAPVGRSLRVWVSNLILLGLGVAIYPHAIQRIFAARDLKVLRRSLGLMAFMPLATTLLAFLIGYIALSRYPGLDQLQSDKVTVFVLGDIIGNSAFTYWLVVIVFAAVVAAIMSTADSALLAMAAMFTKDLYRPYLRPGATTRELLWVGKLFGWALMAFLIAMAWVSHQTESSIWLLIKLKLEFMVQLVPAIVIGVHWRRMTSQPTFWGMVLGTSVTLVIWLGVVFGWWQDRSPLGFSAGVWGLALNLSVAVIGSVLTNRAESGPETGN